MGSPSRDNQRQKAYNWEHRHLRFGPQNRSLTLEECDEFIAKACERYGVPKPVLKDGRGCRIARGGMGAITLPRWARSVTVTLHEVAHSITSRRHPGTAWHGPEWMRVFVDLLEVFGGHKRTDLMASVREARLKISPATACAPPKRGDMRRVKEVRERMREIADIRKELWEEYKGLQDELYRLTKVR